MIATPPIIYIEELKSCFSSSHEYEITLDHSVIAEVRPSPSAPSSYSTLSPYLIVMSIGLHSPASQVLSCSHLSNWYIITVRLYNITYFAIPQKL
jgi:hypothetical protein